MEDERNYVAEAEEQGWVDKDHWKGDPEQHTDAKAFVEKGEKIAGILKSKVDRQGRQIEQLQESNKQFGEYHKQTLAQQEQKAKGRISDLKGQLAQAITDGDGQAYNKLNEEIDSIQVQQNPTNDAQAWNAMAQSWASENKWYQENPKLAIYADGLAERIQAEGYSGQAYFSELTRRVQEDNPEEFTNTKRNKPNSVESGGPTGSSTSKERSYDNLPPDAKAACDSFVKDGFMTAKDYVATYEFE